MESLGVVDDAKSVYNYRFINAFETPSEVILVMEYLDGGELFERVAADDFNLTESDCCLFMRQICRGVQYLHNHNIVHLDLKVKFKQSKSVSSKLTEDPFPNLSVK